jgi:small glutamine-rich tetratricopeptide repeat-containing protein alpha
LRARVPDLKSVASLRHALYSLGRFPEAVSAYEKGLNLDPTNTNFRDSLANARSRLPNAGSDSDSDDDDDQVAAPAAGSSRAPGAGAGGMPDFSSMASMMAGMGGGGAGGMPDISAMMKNPQLMEMAQKMMANGGLEKLMSVRPPTAPLGCRSTS